MMKPIKFEDLCPEPGEFTLKATGKTYRIRPVTLEDESWMQKRFDDRISEIFEKVNIGEIAVIVFRLLDNEARRDFVAQEVEEVQEDGSVKRVSAGGVDLLRRCISGPKEKLEVFGALMQTIGLSRPIQDEIYKEAEIESQKKSEPSQSQSTGDGSLTSSPASTDTPSPKLGP